MLIKMRFELGYNLYRDDKFEKAVVVYDLLHTSLQPPPSPNNSDPATLDPIPPLTHPIATNLGHSLFHLPGRQADAKSIIDQALIKYESRLTGTHFDLSKIA